MQRAPNSLMLFALCMMMRLWTLDPMNDARSGRWKMSDDGGRGGGSLEGKGGGGGRPRARSLVGGMPSVLRLPRGLRANRRANVGMPLDNDGQTPHIYPY